MMKILYVTDLYYVAKGRKYYEEDLFITSRLQQHFNVIITNPRQAANLLDGIDALVFRNAGCVLEYEEEYNELLKAVKERNLSTFNSFDGKGDQKGKQYLLDLQALGFPVIPTAEKYEDSYKLGEPEQYIVKLKNGADSVGMEILSPQEFHESKPEGKLIQPFIDFRYEVSFYYLNDVFQYAMYAPNKERRWELTQYEPTRADLEFAQQFLQWNNMQRGITRVDACRLRDESLLLVELEDLNPFLSLDLLPEEEREQFIDNFIEALKKMAPAGEPVVEMV
ncbi:hypothetical protein FHG64_05580 [Antarcticibacterium flavum]|uniref:ATP-grasp domain-containing protein n=1 Tax=Antarcticibacterium flavum TaxID=2058175 RepID=A0A5B7X002_9FLAO|nr:MULTISPECIES: hypothetical protein [Antarcticibacterium]MCM4159916.1 hypothetical protein [Antarcticibacterium sp. W02-3]QCY68914.1 hypothetical protein FHG64_05580 [Antarcticibacterium flavum]